MPITQRYLVVKKSNSPEIIYYEYDKIKGLELATNKNLRIRDAININKMIIINPTLIQKMIDKKINKRFSKILSLLTKTTSSDEETGDAYMEALTEASRLRMEVINKYRNYMEEEAFKVFDKKVKIIESELRNRLNFLYYQNAIIKNEEVEVEYTSNRRR